MKSTVLSSNKTVTTLASLRNDYAAALRNGGVENPDTYSSWKLKEKLKKSCGDQLTFIERPGFSDLVCANNLTVSDVLKKSFPKDEKDDVSFSDIPPQTVQMDEMQILSLAAGILRERMANIKRNNDYYMSSLEVDVSKCGEFVPDNLYEFIMWIVNKQAFDNVSSCKGDSLKKENLKVISVCHNIISQSRHVVTPLMLGIALRIHHEFGSKQLVNEMHTLGYSASYDEVCRFLTSVVTDQNKEDVYVPKGIEKEKHILVDAAIDNFDQNEETIDGKGTTHAMAAVLYKRCDINPSECHIPRVQSKSLSSAEALKIDSKLER